MANCANATAVALLIQQIDSLESLNEAVPAGELANALEAIRRSATLHGLGAVAPIVHALSAALARGERGPVLMNGTALLRDAARCGDDRRNGAALAAACSLRVHG